MSPHTLPVKKCVYKPSLNCPNVMRPRFLTLTFVMPILKQERLRLREVKSLAQSHTEGSSGLSGTGTHLYFTPRIFKLRHDTHNHLSREPRPGYFQRNQFSLPSLLTHVVFAKTDLSECKAAFKRTEFSFPFLSYQGPLQKKGSPQ